MSDVTLNGIEKHLIISLTQPFSKLMKPVRRRQNSAMSRMWSTDHRVWPSTSSVRHLQDVFGLVWPLFEYGTDVCRTFLRECQRLSHVISGPPSWIEDGTAGNDVIPELGRVFLSLLWRWRKVAALRLPVTILDGLICGTGNEVIQDGDRKRKGSHFPPPSQWNRKTLPTLLLCSYYLVN